MSDETKALIRKVLLMVLTAIATLLHVNSDQTLMGQLPALAADLADLGVFAWGVWAHWGMKKVPDSAVVVSTRKGQ